MNRKKHLPEPNAENAGKTQVIIQVGIAWHFELPSPEESNILKLLSRRGSYTCPSVFRGEERLR